jgi:hypothetical protein
VLNASCLAGAEQSPPEEAAEAVTPRELLMTGPGYQNHIPTELIDDPLLTASNKKTFKQAYKELYDYAMVSRDNSSACSRCQMTCF